MSAPSLPVLRAIIAHKRIPVAQKYVLLSSEILQTRDTDELVKQTGMSKMVVGESLNTPYDLSAPNKQEKEKNVTETFLEMFEKHIERKPTFSERTRWRAVRLFLHARYDDPDINRILVAFFQEKQRFGYKDKHSEPLSLIMNKHDAIFRSLRGT